MAKFFWAVLLAFLLITHAQADVTVISHYRMGEFDGASPGAVATNSGAIGPSLTLSGGAVYSDDTPNDDSSLSIDFDGSTGYGLSANPGPITNNFGVDLWVKPAAIVGGEHIILYVGDSGSDGWGIFQSPVTGKFCALFGGRVIFGQGDVIPGQWTHLAFVCTDSNATFYVNGAPSGPSVTQLPNPPVATSALAIGASPNATTISFFQGKIDEVRIFQFAPGAFVPADLSYTATRQPAIQLTHSDTNTVLSWPTAHFAFVLETATNLSSGWVPFFRPPHTNGNFVVSDTASGDSCFYRLRAYNGPYGGPPLLNPGNHFHLIRGEDQQTFDVTDTNDSEMNAIAIADPASIDAGDAFYVSFDPNGLDNVPLLYHWVVIYPPGPITSPFTDAGINGHHNALLQFQANSMVAQIVPPVEFRVDVTSPYASGLTRVGVLSQVSESALSLTVFNSCKAQTVACPTCVCKEAVALPPTEAQ